MKKLRANPFAVLAVLSLTAGGAAFAATAPPDPIAWAFPGTTPAKTLSTTQMVSLPGSKVSMTEAQSSDRHHAVDWFPDTHPAMPPLVKDGHNGGDVSACGYCHMPTGRGRPENAALAGLPATYIREQASDFKSGARKSLAPDWSPQTNMDKSIAGATDAEIAAAADYFSKLPFKSWVRVIEGDKVPAFTADGYVYRLLPGKKKVDLGTRIIEGPDKFEGFDMRDPNLTYFAYVPMGSVERGKALAATGGNGKTLQCAICHGADFKGGLGPPLAGRSPTGIVRNLYAFQIGYRKGVNDAQMAPVVAHLTMGDMIDLAAYVASQKP